MIHSQHSTLADSAGPAVAEAAHLRIDVAEPLRRRAVWALESLLAATGVRWKLAGNDETAQIGYGCEGTILSLDHDPTAWSFTDEEPVGDDVARVFWWLARVEEQLAPPDAFDRHGRFRAAASALVSEHTAAPVDEIVLSLRAALADTSIAAERPSWPAGHRFAVALTHDIDIPWLWSPGSVRRALRRARRGERSWTETAAALAAMPIWRLRGDDPCCNARHIGALEARHGASSTSYILHGHHAPADGPAAAYARGGERYRADVVASGGVLGLHGSYTTSEVPERLEQERASLAEVAQTNVVDHRFHYLRHRPVDHWPMVAAAGLRSDASLGHAERPGFRAGCSFPFRAWDHERDEPTDLVVVPLAFMDATLEPRYLDLDPGSREARAVVDDLIAHAAATGSGFSVLWHNDKLPPAPGHRRWTRLYEHVLARTAQAGGWATDTGSLAQAWRASTTGGAA